MTNPGDNQMNTLYKVTPHSNIKVKRLPLSRDPGTFNQGIDIVPCTFLGGLSAQPFTALYAWERFLGPLDFKRFVELGMGYGNTSVFFWLHCYNKGARYYGYEIAKPRGHLNSRVKRLIKLGTHRYTKNMYCPTIIREVHKIMGRSGVTVIFCDGIDKPYEFEQYAPGLKHGDYIAVHDWGRASKQEWLQPTIDNCGLVPVEPEVWDALNSITRVWVKE